MMCVPGLYLESSTAMYLWESSVRIARQLLSKTIGGGVPFTDAIYLAGASSAYARELEACVQNCTANVMNKVGL